MMEGMGLCYLKLRKYQEARVQFHHMVFHLNPDDHQAMRLNYVEACWMCGHFDEMEDLFHMYPGTTQLSVANTAGEHSASFAFSLPLLEFKRHGNTKQAR